MTLVTINRLWTGPADTAAARSIKQWIADRRAEGHTIEIHDWFGSTGDRFQLQYTAEYRFQNRKLAAWFKLLWA